MVIDLSYVNIFSQDIKVQPPETPVSIVKESEGRSGELNPDVNIRTHISEIEQLMLASKKSGDIERVLQLQKEMDKLSGSVTMQGEKLDMKLVSSGNNTEEGDNINAGLVSSATGVKGINTCTEQIGYTASRIWTAFVFGPNSGVVNDQLRLCYSDDGGRTWNEKATISFSSGNRMWQDQIDIELIENTTGDKFIWVVFGYATNNYSGVYRVGVTIVRITGDLNFAGYTLNWPGAVSSNFYWKPRVVSDNEAYR